MKHTVIIPSTHWKISSKTNSFEIDYPFADIYFTPNKTYTVTLTTVSSNVHYLAPEDDIYDENYNSAVLPQTYTYHLNPVNFYLPSYLQNIMYMPKFSSLSNYSYVLNSTVDSAGLRFSSVLLRLSLIPFKENFNTVLQKSTSITFSTHFGFNPDSFDCCPTELTAGTGTLFFGWQFVDTINQSSAIHRVTTNTKDYRCPKIALLSFLAPTTKNKFYTSSTAAYWQNLDGSSSSVYESIVGGSGGLVVFFGNYYNSSSSKVQGALELQFGYYSEATDKQLFIRDTIFIDDKYLTYIQTQGNYSINGLSGALNSTSSATTAATRQSVLSNYSSSTDNDAAVKKMDCYFMISVNVSKNKLDIKLTNGDIDSLITSEVLTYSRNLTDPFTYFCKNDNINYDKFRFSVGFNTDTYSTETVYPNALREKLTVNNAFTNSIISTPTPGLSDFDLKPNFPINIYKTGIYENLTTEQLDEVNEFEPLEDFSDKCLLDFNARDDLKSSLSVATTKEIKIEFFFFNARVGNTEDRAGLYLYGYNNVLVELTEADFENSSKSDFNFVNLKPNLPDAEWVESPNKFRDILINNQNEIVFKNLYQTANYTEVLSFLQGNSEYNRQIAIPPSGNASQFGHFSAVFRLNREINILNIQFKNKIAISRIDSCYPTCFRLSYKKINESTFTNFIEVNNIRGRSYTNNSSMTLDPTSTTASFFPLVRHFPLDPKTPIVYKSIGGGLSAIKSLSLNIANQAYLDSENTKKIGIVSRFVTPNNYGNFNNSKTLKYKFTTKNPENIEKLITSVVPNITANTSFDFFAFPPNVILEFEPLEPVKRLSGRKRKNFLV